MWRNNKNNFKKQNRVIAGYSELNILINHQNIMSQKVSILSAINVVIISIAITLSLKYKVLDGLIVIIPYCISLLINIFILTPNISRNTKHGYYFMNYYKINKQGTNILDLIDNEENIEKQLEVNSQILRRKYILFSISIAFSLLPISIFFPFFKSKIK